MHLDASFLAAVTVCWEVTLCIASDMGVASRNTAFEKLWLVGTSLALELTLVMCVTFKVKVKCTCISRTTSHLCVLGCVD